MPTGRPKPLTRERIQENLRKGEEARKELERDVAVLRGRGPGAPAKGVVRTLGILFPDAYPLRLQEGLVVRRGRVPGGGESGGPTDYKWAVAVTWPGGWHDDGITIPDEDVQKVRAHLERGDVLVYLETREEGEPALTLAFIPPTADGAPSEPATAPNAPAAPSPLPASPDLATGALGPSEGK